MKVFVEYKIKHEFKEKYLQHMRHIMEKNLNLELYKGTDQPHLYVEIWNDINYEQYELMKHERQPEKTSNGALLASYIEGGSKGVHIWHFTKLTRTNSD